MRCVPSLLALGLFAGMMACQDTGAVAPHGPDVDAGFAKDGNPGKPGDDPPDPGYPTATVGLAGGMEATVAGVSV